MAEKGTQLTFDGRNQIENTINNYLIILRGDPYFADIQYNLLTRQIEHIRDNEVVVWSDTDDAAMRNYIEIEYGIRHRTNLADALTLLSQERQYHPIKQIIEAIKWDGQERIAGMLIKWLGCEDSAYSREVSRLIFAGGINRIYRPGCKYDDMPVLVGTRQGEGKSTFVRWLAMQDSFYREICEIEGARGIEAIRGAWICEVSELLALTKAKDQEAVKAYLSRQEDWQRDAYGRRPYSTARQCVFIGTTNKAQFLTDKTGNRRFYPIVCKQTGYELYDREAECRADIAQAWAEAKYKLDKGLMPPYADRKLLHSIREEQSAAMEDDYRVGLIEHYLHKNKPEIGDKVCIIELWVEALNNKPEIRNRRDSTDVAAIMDGCFDKWERGKAASYFAGYGSQKYWQRTKGD